MENCQTDPLYLNLWSHQAAARFPIRWRDPSWWILIPRQTISLTSKYTHLLANDPESSLPDDKEHQALKNMCRHVIHDGRGLIPYA